MRWGRAVWAAGVLLAAAGAQGQQPAQADGAVAAGRIGGRVVEAGSERPLALVSVVVEETQQGTMTDSAGRFAIGGVAPGTYRVRAEGIGWAPAVRTDVVVRPGRVASVELQLSPAAVALGAVVVRPTWFGDPAEPGPARVQFAAEEIRRAPGSAGDVSRILFGLPSVAKVNDQSNGLAVRGGTPSENLFLVDGIAVPNINHFPAQGSSSGPIGLLNVELIRDVEFHAGGFGAHYGDRLSSVLDITLRDGDDVQPRGQLSLDLTGLGGVGEGPLGGGSWLASVRRSYLDLLVNMVDVGASAAPRYGDYALRLATSAAARHRFTLLGLWADDRFETDVEQALDHGNSTFGRQVLLQGTTGGTWTALWSDGVLSRTTFAHNYSSFDEDYMDTPTEQPVFTNRSTEHGITVRHGTRVRVGRSLTLNVGGDAAWQRGDYDNRYHSGVNELGDDLPGLTLTASPRALRAAAFLSATHQVTARIAATAGVRGNYHELTGSVGLSPRVSAAVRLDDRTTVSAAWGEYRQSLPMLLLAHAPHRNLPDPLSQHVVLGVAREMGEGARLTVEGWHKRYSRLPMDPAEPALMPLDEMVLGSPFFRMREVLVADGRAEASGVEVVFQQKLTGSVHALISGAYSSARYRALDGVWRPRAFDNRLVLAAEGGWRLGENWQLSARWIHAGGAPYTPLDEEASRTRNRTVLDGSRVAAERLPAYHSLNVRADRRFDFRRSSIASYLSVWNAYDRANVASYYWNSRERRVDTTRQWGLLPIFGVEWFF